MARFNLEDYEPVEARLKRFWADHPNGAVHSEIVAVTADQKSVMVRALVFFDRADAMAAGMGLAQETAGGSGANSTSWLENCDTSAVGRALANCGYSGDKRASREEMTKANRGQGGDAPRPAIQQTEPDAPPRTAPGNAPACNECGKALTAAQSQLSNRNYGQPLCPEHQRAAGRTAA